MLPSVFAFLVLAPVVAQGPAAPAASTDEASALLRRFDAVMSPYAFEADVRMTATREDGSTRTYEMHVWKLGADKIRATFRAPSSAKGQEMLRHSENLWLYMPNLKRAVRIAARDSFMGGDFNNADALRVHYQSDYHATLRRDVPSASEPSPTRLLELQAKTTNAAYDRIELWMTGDGPAERAQPVRARYYAKSGKLLRSAEFLDVKDYGGGIVRPSRLLMTNALIPTRSSEMTWLAIEAKKGLPATRFVVDDLGR